MLSLPTDSFAGVDPAVVILRAHHSVVAGALLFEVGCPDHLPEVVFLLELILLHHPRVIHRCNVCLCEICSCALSASQDREPFHEDVQALTVDLAARLANSKNTRHLKATPLDLVGIPAWIQRNLNPFCWLLAWRVWLAGLTCAFACFTALCANSLWLGFLIAWVCFGWVA